MVVKKQRTPPSCVTFYIGIALGLSAKQQGRGQDQQYHTGGNRQQASVERPGKDTQPPGITVAVASYRCNILIL